MTAHERSSLTRLRARSAVALFILYGLLTISFWVGGALAYLYGASGPARLLGLLYLPSLALPVVGQGDIAGIAVESSLWWWWFAAQGLVVSAAICLYPYERPSRLARSRPLRRARVPISI